MTKTEMVEWLDAVHNSVHVLHHLPNRGGVLIVGPPESMKTTLIDAALKPYPDALTISDLNVQQLGHIKGDLSNGRYRTMAFREFSKLFERDPRTASGLIGSIRAMVDEGYKPAFHDQRMQGTLARCLVIAAMTEDFYTQHFNHWEKSGFLRRFVCLVYKVENIRAATKAILANDLLSFNGIERKIPGRPIPFELSDAEKKYIEGIMREQRGMTTPVALMCKIFVYLRWKYHNDPKRARYLFDAIEPMLAKNGGILTL